MKNTENIETPKPCAGFAPAPCSATPNALIVAFVQGAQWWDFVQTGATMWTSDRNKAEGEAETRASNGTLGKSPNNRICDT